MPEPASQATSVRAKSHPHKDQFLLISYLVIHIQDRKLNVLSGRFRNWWHLEKCSLNLRLRMLSEP